MDLEIQKYKDPWMAGCKDTKIQQSKDVEIHGSEDVEYEDPMIQRCSDTRLQGFKDVDVLGSEDLWT